MSFRDNLQHLRSTKNMTQEQLAMLLGVSRQSVTKWEAERSYPEMDKLLKLCEIFDCTIDDLVKGDLTSRPVDAACSMPANSAPTDVCGYDEHHRDFATKIPTGVAAILTGIALGMLTEGQWRLTSGDPDTFSLLFILLGIIVGLAFIIPAGVKHSSFNRAHPFVVDFYTDEDRATARRRFSVELVIGIALILTGTALLAVFDYPATENIAAASMMLCTAAGVWLMVNGAMLFHRVNIDSRNLGIAKDLAESEIDASSITEEQKAKLKEQSAIDRKKSAVYGAIMLVATIVGLLLLLVPMFSAPDPRQFSPQGTPAAWFWLSWVVGGLLCAVVDAVWPLFKK